MASTDAGRSGSTGRFALLDSLRGAAALAVMGIHLGYHSGAEATAWWGAFTARLNVGVTLFFVLSGFLLYRPWIRWDLGLAARPRTAAYARNRFLRIVPAYWVALSVFAAAGLVQNVWTSNWWAYYGFLQSWRHEWFWGGIGPAWSLSTEVAFYTVLPLLAWSMTRLAAGAPARRAAARQATVLVGLGLLSLGFRAWSFGGDLAEYNQTILSLFLWFAVGMLLAVAKALRERGEAPSRLEDAVVGRPGLLWAAAGGLYVAMCLSPAFPRSFAQGHTLASFLAEHVLFALVSLLLILPAVFGEDRGGFPRRLLSSATLTRIGHISYGIFLWHEPLVSALARKGATGIVAGWPLLSLTLASLPPVLVLAWLSHRLVEDPALRYRSR